jgi:hypothetical protein
MEITKCRSVTEETQNNGFHMKCPMDDEWRALEYNQQWVVGTNQNVVNLLMNNSQLPELLRQWTHMR